MSQKHSAGKSPLDPDYLWAIVFIVCGTVTLIVNTITITAQVSGLVTLIATFGGALGILLISVGMYEIARRKR